MYYVVALGNPGEKYSNTRHNMGWLVMDYVLKKFEFSDLVESGSLSGFVSNGTINSERVTVLYPNTYMNNSGSAVVKLISENEASHLIVVHDDVDLPFGELKIVIGRGSGGNNGVQSIIEKLGTNKFIRIRVGIAKKSLWTGEMKRPQGGVSLEDFVLKSFSISERRQLPEIFETAKKAMETIIFSGVEVAMNKFN